MSKPATPTPAPASPGIVIFLDVDGVLNRHDRHPRTGYCGIDRDLAERFDHLLAISGAVFVVSSAWRYLVHGGAMPLEGLRHLFRSHWIDGDRLVGITRPDTLGGDGNPLPNERGKQISEWIVGPGWSLYGESGRHVVLDDLDLGISDAGHPFVQTEDAVGLTFDDCIQVLRLLGCEYESFLAHSSRTGITT